MDAVSYSHSAKQAQRIEKFIENPDSTSGVLTQPSVIQTGETVNVPAGRTAILANTQIDGTLTVDGTVFIPSGATLDGVVEKVVSTDNAVVRFNGGTGEVQDSGVIITDENRIVKYNGALTDASTLNAATLFPSSKPDLQFYRDSTGNAYQFIHVGNLPTDASSAFTRRAGLHMSLSHEGSAGESSKSADIFVESTSIFSNAPSLVFGVGNSKNMVLDTSGNLLLTAGTGALGYGTGSGGTVTQLTSKSTAVTLNKPTGQITMHNAALAAGATVVFTLNNSTISGADVVIADWNNGNYRVTLYGSATGSCAFIVQNVSAGSLSDSLAIQFLVIKGATA